MTQPLPDGFLDPTDVPAVQELLGNVLERLGPDALVELLAQVPGLAIEPGRPGGVLRKAVPASVTVGQDLIRLSRPAVRQHVVGGVVLSTTPLPDAVLPELLAIACRSAVQGSRRAGDVSVLLTSTRDALAAAD